MAGLLENFEPSSYSQDLEKLYSSLLEQENTIRPIGFASAVINLLKFHPDINSDVYALSKIELLHKISRLCHLPDFQIEEILTKARKEIVINHDEYENNPNILKLQETIALNCSNNEFIFHVSEEETNVLKVHLINSIPYFRYLMMGIGLLLIMRYRPKGILPEKIKQA